MSGLRSALEKMADQHRLLSTYKAFTDGARAAYSDSVETIETILAANPEVTTGNDWGLAHADTLQPAVQGEEQEIRDLLKDMNADCNFHIVRRQAATPAGPWKPSL